MKTTLRLTALVALCFLLSSAVQAAPLADQAPTPLTPPVPLFLNETPTCASPSVTPALPSLDPMQEAVQRSACSATATCGVNPSVSCSGNSSCTSVDRDCSVQANGWVTCDGVTTVCTHNQSCLDGCAADWDACVANCPFGPNPCRTECNTARGYCHCNC